MEVFMFLVIDGVHCCVLGGSSWWQGSSSSSAPIWCGWPSLYWTTSSSPTTTRRLKVWPTSTGFSKGLWFSFVICKIGLWGRDEVYKPYTGKSTYTFVWFVLSTRFLVNFSITFGFFGFWHVALYLFNWSERPFQPGRSYRVGKVVHNMWYSLLGVVQFTVWEAIYVYCCATNRSG